MIRILCSIGLLLLLFQSCKKDKASETNKNDIEIKFGSICGWCSGADSIAITANAIYYHSYNPCDTRKIFKDTVITYNNWNNLVSKINLETFKTINVNSCNVCADGCDYWISIKSGSETHQIRYGYNDSTLVLPIKPFINILDSITKSIRRL